MKLKIFILLLFPILVIGQTTTENYIKSKQYKQQTTVSIASPSINQADQSVVYYDGLGRPIQQVEYGQSFSGKDIVTPMEYDGFGKQVKEYLPYVPNASASLDYKSSGLTDVISYYNTPTFQNTTNPYDELRYDNSPLDRVLEKAIPGTDWSMANSNKHTVRFEYNTNVATGIDAVKDYRANATWNVTKELYDISLVNASGTVFYASNQLFKKTTKNENWVPSDGKNNTTDDFVNKDGKLILKRTYTDYKDTSGAVIQSQVYHDTYYVYDQFDNLTYIIPPSVTNASDNAQIESFCYQYKYDFRNRLVEKKVPTKQWEFIVYDKLDRPVASGPTYSPFPNLLAPNNVGWIIIKYDNFNRPVYTGWLQSTTVTSDGRKLLQSTQNGLTTSLNETKTTSGTIDGVSVYYSNLVAPTTFKLLTVNYYDDYNFPNAPTSFANVEGQPVYYNTTVKPKGLQTGLWERVLQSTTQTDAEISYNLFDYKARPIRSYTKNYLGGYTQVDYKLDFIGKPLYFVVKHKRINTSAELITKEEFTYSGQDFLLTQTHQITYNGVIYPKQLLSKNTYNELGELNNKKVGGNDITATTFLQKIDYNFNIHGWLTNINDVDNLSNGSDPLDLFTFKINYNTVDNGQVGISPIYNGNISQTHWRTSNDVVKRSYGYKYDNLNRLLDAKYERPANPSNPNQSPIKDTFNESIMYDKSGNIVFLLRNGGEESQTTVPVIDQLSYFYNNNKLARIKDGTNNSDGFLDGTDASVEVSYDVYGNMIRDDNKGITSISYNHLNLPTEIVFAGTNKKIVYLYSASGEKLSKVVTNNSTFSTTDYLHGFQYNNEQLQFFGTSEGYVKNTLIGSGYSFDYVFNYKDHLGNIRLSYGIDPTTHSLKIFEENNYYAFGLKHGNYNQALRTIEKEEDSSLNKSVVLVDRASPTYIANSGYQYKFQETERQDELGLNFDSFAYRNYDPAIGRFMNVDPLTEEYHDWSPYVFGGNQVIHSRELEGLEPANNLNDTGETSNTSWITAGFNGGPPLGADEFTKLDMNGGTFKEVVIENKNSKSALSTAGEIALGFVPGSDVIGMYQGARDGNWGQFWMSAAFVTFDVVTLGSGSLIKGGIKAGLKAGAKELAEEGVEKLGKTIVGETMERVNKEALKHPGAVTLNNMPKFVGKRHEVTSQMMAYNRKWILDQMRSGRTMIDIGRDLKRTKGLDMKNGISIFYQMEQNMIKNFNKLHPNTLNVIKK